jgi:uncharacterized protein (DUF1810 family)
VSEAYDLERFVAAQNAGEIYERALRELRVAASSEHAR